MPLMVSNFYILKLSNFAREAKGREIFKGRETKWADILQGREAKGAETLQG